MIQIVIPSGVKEQLTGAAQDISDSLNYIESGRLIKDAADVAIELIKQRTERDSKDYKGNTFKDYSPKYKRWKIKVGRYRDKVDLNLYGTMLGAIKFTIGANKISGVIEVNDQMQPRGVNSKSKSIISVRDLAEIHHFGKRPIPERAFFSWRAGSQEDETLQRMVRKLIEHEVREALRAKYS